MAIDLNSALSTPTSGVDVKPHDEVINPKSVLQKDDFMKLLLLELQYQDPTDPMDSDKILSQTSELASLEAQDNTNKTLELLTNQLKSSMGVTAIGAIGKMASMGNDKIAINEGENTTFEVYFPKDVQSGTLSIEDLNGNVIRTIDLAEQPSGIQTFEWDGISDGGESVGSGYYRVKANYLDGEGNPQQTAYGYYPIESVRFDDGDALLKLGSRYVPLDQVVEIYEGS
jgi:flagellar basal-body rod modification protein FlgD